MLGQALAQQIANEITDVIGHNVLITDESGIVLGSGDESSVGQFHEASVEVVRCRRTMAHSSEDVRDLVGTLPGVTIPLVIDDEVVGTIGLSGSPEEVVQFGLVVKRQTEILMQEAARIGTRMTHERATAELLREICEWHHSGVAKTHLLRRGRALGHDLNLARRIVLVQRTGIRPRLIRSRSSASWRKYSRQASTLSPPWRGWWSRSRRPRAKRFGGAMNWSPRPRRVGYGFASRSDQSDRVSPN